MLDCIIIVNLVIIGSKLCQVRFYLPQLIRGVRFWLTMSLAGLFF